MNFCFYYQLVKKVQLKDKNALMELIQKFSPLMKKYSRKLNYDGAESDLIIGFIEILNKVPLEKTNMKNNKYILGYINTAVKNKFIALSKHNCSILNNEVELNLDITGEYKENSIENKLILKAALLSLPKYQRKIIVEEFCKDKTESELSKELKVSRQAINKTKNTALNNIKRYLIKAHCMNLGGRELKNGK
jgi:RNA polymerase sigma factor (sigma-70 family)